jgi:hypothetical protein
LSAKEEGPILDFEKIVPIPKCLLSPAIHDDPMIRERNIKNCGHADWSSWSDTHWGVKNNCRDIQIFDKAASFLTAWSPPIPIIIELSRKSGASLRLVYIEEGWGICGELRVNPDGELQHEQYHIDQAPARLLEEVR